MPRFYATARWRAEQGSPESGSRATQTTRAAPALSGRIRLMLQISVPDARDTLRSNMINGRYPSGEPAAGQALKEV